MTNPHICRGSDNGDYDASPSASTTLVLRALQDAATQQRFWSKVAKPATLDDCWLWTGNLTGQLNHGQFHVGRFGRRLYNEYAHRVSWMLRHGPIPAGRQINHHCDVPACVNPRHLYLGTQLDNMRDAVRRHRFPLTRRPRKLPDQCVLAIRALAAQGTPLVNLADAFRVSKAAISQIVNRQRRTHVESCEEVA